MPTLTERFVADIEGLSDLPSLSPIRDALLRLSLARIRRLALVASLYDAVPVRGTQASRAIFWQHSLAVAHCSEIIARHAIGAPADLNPESVFLSGLLHDLGLLVLESHYPSEAPAVTRRAGAGGGRRCRPASETS